MLILKRGSPEAVTVQLSAGASIKVRPATSAELYVARSKAMALTASILAGAGASAQAAAFLGEEFAEIDEKNTPQVDALAERIVLLELATLCAVEWEGVVGEDGAPLDLNEGNLALLLRDPRCATAIEGVLNRTIHEERAEKNG